MQEYGLPPLFEIEAFLSDVVDVEPDQNEHLAPRFVADELSGLGLNRGEVVLIRMSNSASLLAVFFGVLAAGGVPSLLSPSTRESRVRDLAAALGARFLIVPSGSAQHHYLVRRDLGSVQVAGLGDTELVRHDAGDVIVLTSGTSGALSGCLHRASSLVRNARRHAESVRLRSSDTVLVNLPLNFSYALVAQAIASLVTGARLVVSPPFLSSGSYSSALKEHCITSSSLTPFTLQIVLNGGELPTGSLRMITVGGDALDPGVAKRILAQAPSLELYITYGLTEAGPRVSTLSAHLEQPERFRSVGRPIAGVQATLRDPDARGVGELLVASDTVLRERVGVTEGRGCDQTLEPQQIATGDLFRIDEDGYLYFQGRLSDFVVTRGTKVSLPSIRRIADAVPGVASSVTRTRTDEHANTYYDLDLYLTESGAEQEERVRRTLLRQLTRGEWPDRIAMLPFDPTRHK